MTETRILDHSSAANGADWAQSVDDTVNGLSGLHLGRLKNVAGTNEITGTLALETGFSALVDGAKCSLIPVTPNGGAVTLQLKNNATPIPGNLDDAYPIRKANGDELEEGDFVAGKLVDLEFNSTDAFWRVTSHIDVNLLSLVGSVNYAYVDCVQSTQIWVAPFDCVVRLWMIAPGGSGAALNGSQARATGGGAGQTVIKSIILSAGDELVITVGQPGLAQGENSHGQGGGNISITGPNGLSLIAYGGKGGTRGTSGSVEGGKGGGRSPGEDDHGGDYAFNGGNGGDASSRCATGGGAVGLWQDGYSSNNNSTIATATNGAGLDPDTSLARFKGCNMGPFVTDGKKGGTGDAVGGNGGNFCGGGGKYEVTGASTAGDGGLGAGGGGCSHNTDDAVAGDGGPGLVMIQFDRLAA